MEDEHSDYLEWVHKRENSLFVILGKYGKLKGTPQSPRFSDRECVKEILGVFKE